MTVFFLLFAVMWISQIQQVTSTGDLPDGSYKEAPTVFWVIRYLDLGISIRITSYNVCYTKLLRIL